VISSHSAASAMHFQAFSSVFNSLGRYGSLRAISTQGQVILHSGRGRCAAVRGAGRRAGAGRRCADAGGRHAMLAGVGCTAGMAGFGGMAGMAGFGDFQFSAPPLGSCLQVESCLQRANVPDDLCGSAPTCSFACSLPTVSPLGRTRELIPEQY